MKYDLPDNKYKSKDELIKDIAKVQASFFLFIRLEKEMVVQQEF